ncbi:cell division protein FtsA, partial [Bifidobacterium animalis subsp. lactis]|nr:cell division protein FtsA [Bifidobacterium animalis subsp. lactis]
KRTVSSSESEAKEAYNRGKMSADDSTEDEENNKEKTNGLQSFFKKFFD